MGLFVRIALRKPISEHAQLPFLSAQGAVAKDQFRTLRREFETTVVKSAPIVVSVNADVFLKLFPSRVSANVGITRNAGDLAAKRFGKIFKKPLERMMKSPTRGNNDIKVELGDGQGKKINPAEIIFNLGSVRVKNTVEIEEQRWRCRLGIRAHPCALSEHGVGRSRSGPA